MDVDALCEWIIGSGDVKPLSSVMDRVRISGSDDGRSYTVVRTGVAMRALASKNGKYTTVNGCN